MTKSQKVEDGKSKSQKDEKSKRQKDKNQRDKKTKIKETKRQKIEKTKKFSFLPFHEFVLALCFLMCFFKRLDSLQEKLHCLQAKGFLLVCDASNH